MVNNITNSGTSIKPEAQAIGLFEDLRNDLIAMMVSYDFVYRVSSESWADHQGEFVGTVRSLPLASYGQDERVW